MGQKFGLRKKRSDIEPYPVIPLGFTSKTELEGIRNILQTYFYLVFVRLEGNSLDNEFSKVINPIDEIITFNYYLVLEKSLLAAGIWSPLCGYAGVCQFEKEQDKETLVDAGKYSKLRIHKMHGSINWRIPEPRSLERLHGINEVMIVMDDWENNSFHFDDLLERRPDKTEQPYVGSHAPEWILPSFVKPFKEKEIFQVWQSAMGYMSNTKDLVIIGYSFRPEDPNAFLLLSRLPQKCNIILVDPNPEEIRKRLENKELKATRTFKSLEDFLSEYTV